MRISKNLNGINRFGFCLSVYEKTVLHSQDYFRASLVSTLQNPESLVGGCFNMKAYAMYFSISTKISVFIERLDTCERVS